MNRAAARAALARSERRRHTGRLARALRHPGKLVLARLLAATGRTREIAVPTFWGGRFDALLPEHVSTLIWRFGFTDRAVCLSLLERLPEGGVLVDVGAHFGFFTLLGSALAGAGGRVVAIEAMPGTRARLERNVARNAAHPNVAVIACAAHSGEATLSFRDFGVVDSSLNSAFEARGRGAAAGETVEVPARPLDAILAEQGIARADLVKIDAESSEIHVLEGMTGLIAACQPAIVVEAAAITPEQRALSEAVDAWLVARDYEAWRWQGGKLMPAGPVGAIRYDNLLYLPRG